MSQRMAQVVALLAEIDNEQAELRKQAEAATARAEDLDRRMQAIEDALLPWWDVQMADWPAEASDLVFKIRKIMGE